MRSSEDDVSDIYVGSLFSGSYLEHHGILGMKWGVRRYQNEDGSLTSAGKQRYGSKTRENVLRDSIVRSNTNFYKSRGLSNEEARIAAEKKARLMRNVAIGAAVAIGVTAAYTAYGKYGREYCDNVIKSGTTIQTLSAHTDRMETGEAFYTAYVEGDKQKYAGLFGKSNGLPVENKYKLQAVANKNIKIAGSKNAEKTFKELAKNDDEFNKVVRTIKSEINSNGKSDYELFNTYALLANNGIDDPSMISTQKKFYSALKAKGYGAVADVNDRKYSGFNTRAAIVFDRDNLRKSEHGGIDTRIQKLTDDEIEKGKKYATNAALREALITPSNVAVGSAYLGITTIGLYDNAVVSKTKKKQKDNVKKRR